MLLVVWTQRVGKGIWDHNWVKAKTCSVIRTCTYMETNMFSLIQYSWIYTHHGQVFFRISSSSFSLHIVSWRKLLLTDSFCFHICNVITNAVPLLLIFHWWPYIYVLPDNDVKVLTQILESIPLSFFPHPWWPWTPCLNTTTGSWWLYWGREEQTGSFFCSTFQGWQLFIFL